MINRLQRLLVALGLVALLVPTAAIARPDQAGKGKSQETASAKSKGKSDAKGKSKGKGKKKGHAKKAKTYVFKGEVVSSDAGTVTVKVTGGNKRAKAHKGEELTFNLPAAKRLKVADTDGNGTIDGYDLKAGDKVVVQVKQTKADAEAGVWNARKVVDQTNPPVDEDEKTETEQPQPTTAG